MNKTMFLTVEDIKSLIKESGIKVNYEFEDNPFKAPPKSQFNESKIIKSELSPFHQALLEKDNDASFMEVIQ